MKVPWDRSYQLGFRLKNSHHKMNKDKASLCGFSTVEFEQISPRIHTKTANVAVEDDRSSVTVSSKIETIKKKKLKKKKKVVSVTAKLKSSGDKYLNLKYKSLNNTTNCGLPIEQSPTTATAPAKFKEVEPID
ncbi:unnamed protein product [Cochlearia groenlandica]